MIIAVKIVRHFVAPLITPARLVHLQHGDSSSKRRLVP
jgi:hypothetical protein